MPHPHPIYLDYSATTPTDPRVVEAMLPYFSDTYGNASASHTFGRAAESAIERARATVAAILNCHPHEVIFTSGGSESDNLAIRGIAWAQRERAQKTHLVTTPIEHDAVSNTMRQLTNYMGFSLTRSAVNSQGLVDSQAFANALTEQTALASVIYANNEVGTVQPISDLAQLAHDKGVYFHTDAVQAGGQLSLDTQMLGIDLLSLSAHKFYGPKGIGVLYVRDGIELFPSQSGGSHERGRRAGTHNTPLIVGLAKALELAYAEYDDRISRLNQLREKLITGILTQIPQAQLTGHPAQRLPSHASFVIAGVDSNKLLMHLDMRGIAASSASACKTGNPEPSDVLLALGYDAQAAMGSLRCTLSHHTTEADLTYAIEAIAQSVQKLMALPKITTS